MIALLVATNMQTLLFPTNASTRVNTIIIEISMCRLIIYILHDHVVAVVVVIIITTDGANIDAVYYFLTY